MNPTTEANLKVHSITWYRQHRFIALLPLLEYPFAEACAIIQEASQHEHGPQEARTHFDFDPVMLVALRPGVVSYWAERAIDWIEHGFPLTTDIAQAIDEVIAQKRVPQHARHRAGKLVRQWRTNHTNTDGQPQHT